MRVLLTHSENSAVGYYRVWLIGEQLRKIGWKVKYFPYCHKTFTVKQWCKLIKRLKPHLVVWQRLDSPPQISLIVGIRQTFDVPIVMEVDDNFHVVPKYSKSYEVYHPKGLAVFCASKMLKEASAVTVTTKPLYDAYSRYNEHCYILPNSLDFGLWGNLEIPKKEKDEIYIGWAGGGQHLGGNIRDDHLRGDFEIVHKVLKRIIKDYKNVKLVFFSPGCFWMNEYPQDRVIHQPYVYIKDYPQTLANLNLDIAIAPLIDNEFNRCKSNLKFLEYGALKIPGVYSNVYPYRATIENGKDSFLAISSGEWEEHLRTLIEDRDLRIAMGEEAYKKVRRDFDISENIHLWDSAYRKIIKRGM